MTFDSFVDTGGITGNIAFSNTINGAEPLILNADNVTFSEAVGSLNPLRSLQVIAAGTITVDANQTVSSGPMTYQGNVVLGNNIQFADAGSSPMSFAPISGSAITGNYNLTLRAANSSITVNGDVNLSGSSGSLGGNLSSTSLSTTTFLGQILTQGGDNGAGAGGNGGNVSIAASNGSVSVHNINVSGGTGTSTGGNGGNITLQPASGYSGGFPIGLIVLNSDLSSGQDGNLVSLGQSGGADGTIILSANRSAFATVATITSSLSGNDIYIVGETCTFGNYEALTALGNITLIAATLTIGDTVALGNLVLFGDPINLNTHGDIEILNNQGVLYISPSLHLLGGTGYITSGNFVPANATVNAQSLGLSSPQFRPLLTYSNHILNYDSKGQAIIVSPSAATSSSSFRQTRLYQLLIADAQLSDQLPIYRCSVPRCISICSRMRADCLPNGCHVRRL